jgi:tetratricopeptide (TPR) repeat protein
VDTADQQAQMEYAAVAIYSKNLPLANSILAGLSTSTIAGDTDIITAYNQIGDYSVVLALWQSIIAGSPNNPQNYIHLATVYLEMNDLKDAKSTLQKAQSLDTPNHASAYQTYIDEINKGENPLTIQQKAS